MTTIKERKDITDYVYQYRLNHPEIRHCLTYKNEYVEIDGMLYIRYSNNYGSCTKDQLDLFKINERFNFDQKDERSIIICKCLNKTNFQLYHWGYEGRAVCLECGSDICIYTG